MVLTPLTLRLVSQDIPDAFASLLVGVEEKGEDVEGGRVLINETLQIAQSGSIKGNK